MSLKGTKTEENLKAAFAGESQANRRYLYFAQKADVKVTTMFLHCFAQLLKVKPAMLMAILSILRKWVIPRPACR